MRIPFLSAGGKNLAGVDIGTSSVKVASLKRSGQKFALEALALENLPSDSIVDGAIISKLTVAEAIDRLFRDNGIINDRIATSICGHSVIVKKINVPEQSKKELAESIQWEAEQYVPFDISEVNIDYQLLKKGLSGNRMEVLLVAAKRDKITDHTSVLSMAGKRPAVVDIDAFALQNVYEVNYQPEETLVVALLDIGSSMINVNIVRGSDFLFTRDIAMGGSLYTEHLQRDLNISFEDAEALKRGDSPDGETREKVDGIVQEVSEILALEIEKTFDFFKSTSDVAEVREVYLSGGASRTEGLREFLDDKLEIPVAYLDPFKNVTVPEGKVPSEYTNELASDFAVAVGLALRAANER